MSTYVHWGKLQQLTVYSTYPQHPDKVPHGTDDCYERWRQKRWLHALLWFTKHFRYQMTSYVAFNWKQCLLCCVHTAKHRIRARLRYRTAHFGEHQWLLKHTKPQIKKKRGGGGLRQNRLVCKLASFSHKLQVNCIVLCFIVTICFLGALSNATICHILFLCWKARQCNARKTAHHLTVFKTNNCLDNQTEEGMCLWWHLCASSTYTNATSYSYTVESLTTNFASTKFSLQRKDFQFPGSWS